MKSIKKTFAIMLALCLLLSGCGGKETSSQSKQTKSAPKVKTAMLYTNLEIGSESAKYETHPFEYSGDLTSEKLAQGLSQLTGLDFFLRETPSCKSEEINIDWALSSTLISNLDDREQKNEFRFYDSDSMRWFMMDSLWRTLTENFDVENIYYTMNGGNDLEFDELYPINKFPFDFPYMGSAFYFAHADVKGDVAISEDEAIALVQNAINARGETAPVIVRTGDDSIEGEHVFTFSAGDYSADGEKYTAIYHYAVSDGGKVYYMDILQGADWVLFDK